MKIAILSDTHNNLAYAQLARKKIADAGIRTVIHCGDVIDPGIVDYFGEFRIILVYGNGDYPRELEERISWFRDDNLSSEFLELDLSGKLIYVTHGHDKRRLNSAIECGRYDYVFHGHTHQYRDDRWGRTRVINPGALGGRKLEKRSLVFLDLETDKLERIIFD